ncbi:hypothetical protein OHA44_00260 [Streptomyces sp. NBC_00144]|uniref:hypothetical protein n=1 Tax=Streptomyces sp. NBC_00144 TaxID=2975665 RepID=UPI003248B6C3
MTVRERGDGVSVKQPEGFLFEYCADEVRVIAERGGNDVPGVGHALSFGVRLHGGEGQFVADAVGSQNQTLSSPASTGETKAMCELPRSASGDADGAPVGVRQLALVAVGGRMRLIPTMLVIEFVIKAPSGQPLATKGALNLAARHLGRRI